METPQNEEYDLLKEAEKLERKERREAREEYKDKYLTARHVIPMINSIANRTGERHRTGLTNLDAALEGGLYPGLYVMGAVSSLGKTALAMQIADSIAASGTDVLIFSLEMSRYELIARSVSRYSFIRAAHKGKRELARTTRQLLTGVEIVNDNEEISKNTLEAFVDYREADDAPALHLYINEIENDLTADDIHEQARQHIDLTGNKPVVIVDYLQILTPRDPRESERTTADRNIKRLRQLARDYDLTVLIISSLNRDNYKSRVSMAAFKESGGIEYGADVLIGLQFKGAGGSGWDEEKEQAAREKTPREIEAVILKNRTGKAGASVFFDYYPAYNLFVRMGEEIPAPTDWEPITSATCKGSELPEVWQMELDIAAQPTDDAPIIEQPDE